MTATPIYLTALNVRPTRVLPFTHVLTLASGGWTHESHLELPGVDLVVRPASTPHHYILGIETPLGSGVAHCDRSLDSVAGAIRELVVQFQGPYPRAMHHLVQGLMSALAYFGRQYGYLTIDDEGEVHPTNRRKDIGI